MTTPRPLTDLAFNILVSLAHEERHGYGLVKDLRALPGREALRTGTVYAALARLEEDQLIEGYEATASEDQRRRYYRITEAGALAARAEAVRLQDTLARARGTTLLGDPAHG